MSTDVPLLNDYKRVFVRNRLLQTLTGGLRLSGCPWYAVVSQVVLYAIPALVVAVFYIWTEWEQTGSGRLWAYLICGTVVGVFGILIQILAHCIVGVSKWQERVNADVVEQIRRIEAAPKPNFMEDEEDRLALNGCCGLKTWMFLMPKKRYKLNAVIHPLTMGLTTGLGLYYLRLGNIRDIFHNPSHAVVVVVFAWLAIVNALYSLYGNPPPETATFRALDLYEIGALSRPFHILFLIAPQLILDYLVEHGPFGGIERYWYGAEPWIDLNYLAHIGMACMPIFWFAGLFPTIEAFIFWFGEQIQIFLLGGSASYNPWRFVTYLILSFTQLLLMVILCELETDQILDLVSVAGIAGYILSLDLVGIVQGIFLKMKRTTSDEEDGLNHATKYRATIVKSVDKSGRKAHFSKFVQVIKELFTHLICFGLHVVLLLVYPYQPYSGGSSLVTQAGNGTGTNGTRDPIEEPKDRNTRELSFQLVLLGWLCGGIYLFLKITNEIQKVYALFGCIRGPCHAKDGASLPQTIWFYSRSWLINFGAPLLMTCYVKNLIVEDAILFVDPMPAWFEILAIVRIMRWIWQNSEAALFEVFWFNVSLLLLTPNFNLGLNAMSFFTLELSRSVQLLIIGFLRDRLKQFVEKLYFVVSLTVSSLEDRASKRSYAGCLFQLNLLFFPLVLAFITVSSLLSAPLLAFFTLPIFFIAFPRPIKFWPGPIGLQANCSEDSVYYQQMIPYLIPALHKANRAGRLGILQVGSHLILRHEDRLVWVQILEKGNNFFYYAAKGMELQETSCHSLEATRLDDIFEDTFERQASLNKFIFHTVTPLVSLPIMMYSDTRNVLTGVIESQEMLALIAKTYLQTLVWYLFKSIIVEKGKQSVKVVSTPMEVPPEGPAEHHTDTVVPISFAESVEAEAVSSASVNGVNLDEWPSSESSPDQAQWAQTKVVQLFHEEPEGPKVGRDSDSSSIMFDQMSDIVDGEYVDQVEEFHAQSLPRNKLLPPIQVVPAHSSHVARSDSMESLSKKLDHLYLPGGVLEKTPQARRKEPPRAMEHTLMTPRREARALEGYLANKMAPDEALLHMPTFLNAYEQAIEDNSDQDWLGFALKRLFTPVLAKEGQVDVPHQLDDLLKDNNLMDMYRKVIHGSFLAVYGDSTGRTFNSLVSSGGPALPVKTFSGTLSTSIQADWLRLEAPNHLKRVIIPAYRAAFKLALDQILLGFYNSMEELEENLIDLDEQWYLGLEDDPNWKSAVFRQVPNLFSVAAVEAGGRGTRTLFRSHLLTLRNCDVSVGRLNSEVVKGLWASLNLELLYLTNDDDERYSIQAEERLLRNLTVQVADPPLGYTIHSSSALRQGIEPF